MGTPSVVVMGVPIECATQMPFPEDEHAIGDLAADGADEPFRIGVGSWAARRDFAHGDASVGQDSVEGGGELPGPVTDHDLELVCLLTQVHEQVSGVLTEPRSTSIPARNTIAD